MPEPLSDKSAGILLRGIQVQEKGVCIRAKVGDNKRDALRHEAADEVNVAAKAIELRDDNRRSYEPCLRQRSR
jgi:hypothetical protein